MHTEELQLTFGPTATVGAGELEQPGLVPTVTILAIATGLYYDAAGGPFWVAAPVLNPMFAAAAAMLDFYAANPILPANIDIATVGRDLMVKYEDKTTPDPFTEFEHIVLYESELDRLEINHDIVGSFGELLKVIASLGFRHFIQSGHVFNANGQLTNCQIDVFATKADMPGAPLETFFWTTTYAGGVPVTSVCTT